MNIEKEKFEEYISNVDFLNIMNIKNKILLGYIENRMLAEYANHVYRNSKEETEPILSDKDYDYLIKLLERMESDFPKMKEFFDEVYGKLSLTERVG